MRFIARAICALAAAVILVWGMHVLSHPTPAEFASGDWSNQGPVTPSNPVVVDREARTIRIFARLNGKYLHLPTVHNMNYRHGTVGNKALFRAWGSPVAVARALLSLDAHPGEKLGAGTAGQTVEGEEISVSVVWEGAPRPYPINEVVSSSESGRLNWRFGGNPETARKAKTGCVMCFQSCPVGILSNDVVAQGAFYAGNMEFRGRSEVLPPDATPVTVIFKVPEA